MVKTKVKKEIADAPPEKCFWVHNGPILKNLQELLKETVKMNKETFLHHVNEQKNDFSRWVDEVFNEKELAKALAKVKTKKALIKTIKKILG